MKKTGFTLIELLVVAAIMAMLFAGGLVAVSAFNANNEIKLAKEELYNFLVLARSYAVSSYKSDSSMVDYDFVQVEDFGDNGALSTKTAGVNLVAVRVGSTSILSTQRFGGQALFEVYVEDSDIWVPRFKTYYGTVDTDYTYRISGQDVVKVYKSGLIELQ